MRGRCRSSARAHEFGRIVMLAGMAAPLFLFLAGVAVSLAAASQLRRGRSVPEASRFVQRRGWQIFGYAFLFRLQSFVLGGFAAPASLLKVDILNIMGPAIAVTAALWGRSGTRAGKALWLSLATIALVTLTPIIRASAWIDVLPDPIESVSSAARSRHVHLPPVGRVRAGRRRVGGGHRRSRGPVARSRGCRQRSPSPAAPFWRWVSGRPGGPHSFQPPRCGALRPPFLQRGWGSCCYWSRMSWLWTVRPWRRGSDPSPLETLGAGSLFVYWVHVELIYGVAGSPLRRQLTLEQGVMAWVGVSLAMYALLLSWNGSAQLRHSTRDQVIKYLKSVTWTPRTASER